MEANTEEEVNLISMGTEIEYYRLSCPDCKKHNIIDIEALEKITEKEVTKEVQKKILTYKSPVICIDCLEIFDEEDPPDGKDPLDEE